MPKCSLFLQRRCLGASDSGISLDPVQGHHDGKAEADMGSSGAAVISFQEQITFPAAKDMLGLNKNGNSQQIEQGERLLLTPASPHQCPWVAGWCQRRHRAPTNEPLWLRSTGSCHKGPAPDILHPPGQAPHLPTPCPDAHPSHPALKARTVCLQFPRREIMLKKLIIHLKTKSGCSSAHQG